MRISLVIETWNLRDADLEEGLARLLARVRAQSRPPDEIVVTLAAGARPRLDASIVAAPLPARADYYQHKNRGFDASTGDVVAFTDGDCAPSPGWLEALTAPILAGQARVAAGPTAYPRGPAARAGTALDFPLLASPLAPRAVRNFFANNVAFAREAFAARRYPDLPGMFHGQCQVLALRLLAEGIPVAYAPGATVEHAWPDGPRALLEMRLLRGADARALATRLWPRSPRLGPLPALALLGARAARATGQLLRRPGGARGLAAGAGLIAAASIIDAAGALAPRAVYRRFDPSQNTDSA